MQCMKATQIARCLVCLPKYKFLFQTLVSSYESSSARSEQNFAWLGKTYLFTSSCNYQSSKSQRQKFLDIIEDLDTKEDFSMSPSEWESLEKAVIKENPEFLSLDYSMMKHLRTTAKPELAFSFMAYLKDKRVPNGSTYLEYVDACLSKYEDLGFDEFKKALSMDGLDKGRLQNLCSRILNTKYWKESIPLSFDYLHRTNASAATLRLFLLNILKTALLQQDYKVFYDVVAMKEALDYNQIQDVIYQMLVDKRIPVDVFLELFKVGNCSLTLNQAKYVKDLCFRSNSVRAVFANDTRGACSNCKKKMSTKTLSHEEMRNLRKKIHDNVVVADNVYKNTTPLELETFVKFVKKHGPFSCVIDGLNTAFFLGKGFYVNYDTEVWKKLLTSVSAVAPGKILIVGRYGGMHTTMNVKQISPNVILCQHDFRSSDDSFVLLAAAMSGSECFYISQDKYRDHRYLLEEEAKLIFQEWVLTNRLHVSLFDNAIQVSTHVSTQETNNGWHIPVQLGNRKFSICITKLQYTPSSELLELRKCQKEVLNGSKTKKTILY